MRDLHARSMRDLSRSSTRTSMRDLSNRSSMRDLSSKDSSMRDDSMKDVRRSGTSTRRLNASGSDLSVKGTPRTLGLKLSPETRGDGLFRMPEGDAGDKARWPKLPFFNFSKQKLTDKEGHR